MPERRPARAPGRPVSGLLLVDKPVGPTSFDVVARVRRLCGERQVGHGGTLDPLASGMLPVLVGDATRLSPYLMGLGKRYRATVRLGLATDTYDAEGRTTAAAPPERLAALDEAQVRAALAGFVGRVMQRPPAYSAIKKDGVRMYALARAAAAAGEEPVDVAPREVQIDAIELLRCALPEVAPELEIEIRCGKGTYIRSIAHDLGERLGVGAHLSALRRLSVGDFSVDAAIDVYASDDPPPLLPPERAVVHLPAAEVDAEAERRLRLGQQAPLAQLPLPPDTRGPVRLLSPEGRLVALAEAGPGGLALLRVVPPPG